jgi:uracil-DNA glycosylase
VSDTVRPDARKPLTQLKEEWAACVKCELGTARIEREGHFVFGQGLGHCVMFVGEGPGAEEEANGAPFVGKSGRILRRVLSVLGLSDYYLTNIVCCRSCALVKNADGSPMMRKSFKNGQYYPVYKDEPPLPMQKAACRPRLLEEIYIVDPIVIVGLGGPACEALLGHSITITRDRGETSQIAIPGASYRPVLTEKKQQWLRKVGGEDVAPTEQNEVLYYFVPTLHPAYVARELPDKGPGNAFQKFVADLQKAVRTYDTYLETVFGVVPADREGLNAEELHYDIESENE